MDFCGAGLGRQSDGRSGEQHLVLVSESREETDSGTPSSAFLKCDPLPDPLTLSSVAKTMLSVPPRATEYV